MRILQCEDTHVGVSFPDNTLDMALPKAVISDIMNCPEYGVIID